MGISLLAFLDVSDLDDLRVELLHLNHIVKRGPRRAGRRMRLLQSGPSILLVKADRLRQGVGTGRVRSRLMKVALTGSPGDLSLDVETDFLDAVIQFPRIVLHRRCCWPATQAPLNRSGAIRSVSNVPFRTDPCLLFLLLLLLLLLPLLFFFSSFLLFFFSSFFFLGRRPTFQVFTSNCCLGREPK